MKSYFPHDPAPVWASQSDGTVLYANKQIVKYFLCSQCEDRFSKNGERVIANECFRNSFRFILQQKLMNSELSGKFNTQPYYHPKDLENIDSEKYKYYALSIIWRVTATGWKNADIDYLEGGLSPEYSTQIENYLLGGDPPNDIYITVYVDTNSGSEITPFMSLPSGGLVSEGHFSFFVPGVKFNVYVGEEADKDVSKEFSKQNTQLMFFLHDFKRMREYSEMKHAVTYELRPVGKLAKRQVTKHSKI